MREGKLTEKKASVEDLREVYELFRSLRSPKQIERTPAEERLAELESYNPYFSRNQYRMVSHHD